MRTIIPATALAALFAQGAMAQDFNAAPPNAPGQTPAFEAQTRAPVIDDAMTLNREVIAGGLANPWGMDLLPDGSWIVTERPGRMRIISADGPNTTQQFLCSAAHWSVRVMRAFRNAS